jgi:hypothetical protein
MGPSNSGEQTPWWTVTVAVEERDGRMHAKAGLRGTHLVGVGVAYRHPSDYMVTQIGQELAAARALGDLADRVVALTVSGPRKFNGPLRVVHS